MDAAWTFIVRAAWLYLAFIGKPKNAGDRMTMAQETAAQRAFILNVVLTISIAFIAVLEGTIIYNQALAGPTYGGLPAEFFYIALLVHIGLFVASKKGHARLAAYVLIAFYISVALYSGWVWGASLPATLLAVAWSLVASSIVIGPTFGFSLTSAMIAALGVLAAHEASAPDVPPWRYDRISATDVITYGAILLFISFISWLSNREIKRSLRRAMDSERALARERDELERRVAERTEAFIASELERAEGLERAATFGELSKGLVHDMMNPLSSVSLHLERLAEGSASPDEIKSISRKTIDLSNLSKRLRSYLASVQACIQRGVTDGVRHDEAQITDLRREISVVIDALAFEMRPKGASISIGACDVRLLPMDPIHAHQIFVNLAKNALEAGARAIEISVRDEDGLLRVIVSNDGQLISPGDTGRIFESGFTTKGSTGVGLATVKRIIERNLGGTIEARSDGGKTAFDICIPRKR